MKTVNLTDGTWKRAKRAAVEAEVPLRVWVEGAVVLTLADAEKVAALAADAQMERDMASGIDPDPEAAK